MIEIHANATLDYDDEILLEDHDEEDHIDIKEQSYDKNLLLRVQCYLIKKKAL